LELFVVHDLLQRESHRHAHWLIPAPHFLEREDLLAGQSVNESACFAQLARRVVEPPATTRPEHEFFIDLAVAIDLPLFGDHAFIELVRERRANADGRSRAAEVFDAHEFYRQILASAGNVTLEQLLEQPHGFIYSETDFGHTKAALRTPDRRVDIAPDELVADVRARMAQVPAEPDPRYPLAMISQRRVASMNSWTNDLPGIHRRLSSNRLEINPADAANAGVGDDDWVEVASPVARVALRAVVSTAIRPGVVVCEHGWGSRVFDPLSGDAPVEYGANRNLLVDNRLLDPLSQVPAMSGQHVAVRAVSVSSCVQ
jgi:formate dehydrogenase